MNPKSGNRISDMFMRQKQAGLRVMAVFLAHFVESRAMQWCQVLKVSSA